MIALRTLLHRASLLCLVLLSVWSSPILNAQGTSSGPVVTLDRNEIEPEDRVVLNIDGFESMNVTISVCGNEARRGSVDCNMYASEGLKLDTDGTSTVIQIPVAAPPAPCPCVIRVSNRTFDEIAIAPITLIGHPTAPVVETPGQQGALDVTISAQAASPGLLAGARTSLGGPATYEVTVTVKNTSTVPIAAVSLAGAVVRRDGHSSRPIIWFARMAGCCLRRRPDGDRQRHDGTTPDTLDRGHSVPGRRRLLAGDSLPRPPPPPVTLEGSKRAPGN